MSKSRMTKGTKKNSRPDININNLFLVPDDAIEGYQERIETGVDWLIVEQAFRYHKAKCMQSDNKPRTLSEALKIKLNKSILSGLLDNNSNLTLEEYSETILPAIIWNQENFTNEDEKSCFQYNNSITNDVEKLVKRVVIRGDRNYLMDELRQVSTLRINNVMITELDKSVLEFKYLEQLILCGNYIRDIESITFPENLKMLELQANAIKYTEAIFKNLPQNLLYLGLARNLISDETAAFSYVPLNLTVLDLADNDIYTLSPALESLQLLPSLTALTLAGNPCSVSAGYAITTLRELPRLDWLDNREVIACDRDTFVFKSLDIHPDDMKSAYFFFKAIRVMAAPQPPKPEKGKIGTFHVELELPLLDEKRRNFLMFQDNSSLIEPSTISEYGWAESEPSILIQEFSSKARKGTKSRILSDDSGVHPSENYRILQRNNSKENRNFTVFCSNRVQWQNIMTFQEPAVKIFCPDLCALRNTFRSVITVRLVYTLSPITNLAKGKSHDYKRSYEYRVVLATVRCALQRLDWTQKAQHFHWDNTMETEEAKHWGDGDLEVIQYYTASQQRPQQLQREKKKEIKEAEVVIKRCAPPNLTCHFSFGIETLLHNNA